MPSRSMNFGCEVRQTIWTLAAASKNCLLFRSDEIPDA
jgi:hypothetical protein